MLVNQGATNMEYWTGVAPDKAVMRRVLEEIFGMTSLTDPDTAEKLEEYERLRLTRATLTSEQAARLDALEALLNRRMYGNSDAPEAKKRERDNAFLEQLLAGGSGAPPRTP